MIEVLYGRNAVREALRGPRHIYRLILAEGVKGPGAVADLIAAAEAVGVRVISVPRARLDQMVGGAHHQGVAAETAPFSYLDLEVLIDRIGVAEAGALVLILDSLQDPQNFGTLLRTAEALGVTGVIIPAHRAVGVTPAVANASAGAVEHLAIARAANLPRAIAALQQAGLWVVGIEIAANSVPFTRADFRVPLALVVGSEGSGLGRLVRERCDYLVELPMVGQVSSLNAAVAGSVVLFEVRRQREVAIEEARPAGVPPSGRRRIPARES